MKSESLVLVLLGGALSVVMVDGGLAMAYPSGPVRAGASAPRLLR